VVALHRAACLAGRYALSPQEQPVLYTTFVASLTSVLRNLYERLPQTVPGKVHFVHIDGLARQICEEADQPVAVMLGRMNSAFNRAFEYWKKSDEVQNSPAVGYSDELRETLCNARYMRTEIDNVIKGCGITTEADYMPDKLTRRGRQVAFDSNVRKLVWRLYESYQRQLSIFQTKDYRDQVAAAVRIIESETKPRYRCVIVDESQDLTFMQMRLVAALSGTQSDSNASPDRLFIVGDVAQRVHPNFWTLQELGVEIRGRSAVLTRNYRSTAEIMECAIAIAGSDDVVDIDEETAAYQQDRAARSARHGEIPILVTCADNEIQVEQVVAAVRSAQSRGVGLGDIAVLVQNNGLKDTWCAQLRKAKFEVIELNDYEGVAANEIKVGTYDRAKGLSFKAVLLPDVTEGQLPSKRQELEPADAYAERCALWRSRLYVAATRAREDLAFFCIGEVSEFMTYALDYITKQEA
jgi:superfamily I DNA/RNA helicase